MLQEDVKLEELALNPWCLESVNDFLFYCCVECSYRDKNEQTFIQHATVYHPKSREMFSTDADTKCSNVDEPGEDVNELSNEDFKSDDTSNTTKEEYHETISDVIGSVRFKCSFCDYKSKYKQAVTHHAERIHLKKRHFTCDLCQKDFHQECDLRKHKSAVHERQRKFVCETCGFPCVTKQSLEKHVHSKHIKKLLQCHHCEYSETSSKRFYNHSIAHSKSLTCLPMLCKLCSRAFENDFVLGLHIEFDHQAPKFWCDKCGKQFSTKKGLNFHVSGVHEGLKPYVCPTCGKTFPSKGNMETHIKIAHTKTGSVKCQICGHGSANIFYARKHMKECH